MNKPNEPQNKSQIQVAHISNTLQYNPDLHRIKIKQMGILAVEIEQVLHSEQLCRWEQMMTEGTLYAFIEKCVNRCTDMIMVRIDAYRQSYGDEQMLSHIPQIRSESLQKIFEQAGIR